LTILKGDKWLSNICRWLHEQLEKLNLVRYPFNKLKLPKNGIYFFYEEREIWGHGGEKPRIVRIGTHKNNNFRSRISEHFLLNEKKMNFEINNPKPADRSIFRKNIGRVLLNRENSKYLGIWDKDFIARRNKEQYMHLRDIKKEKEIESKITNLLRSKFSFRYIIFEKEEKRIGSRGLESSLIGTIARCNICKASKNWLGRKSTKKEIAKGKLWQVQHLKNSSINYYQQKLIENAISKTISYIDSFNNL